MDVNEKKEFIRKKMPNFLKKSQISVRFSIDKKLKTRQSGGTIGPN
jgi:uncharacterized FlaG/YvyC family protein